MREVKEERTEVMIERNCFLFHTFMKEDHAILVEQG